MKSRSESQGLLDKKIVFVPLLWSILALCDNFGFFSTFFLTIKKLVMLRAKALNISEHAAVKLQSTAQNRC